VSIFRNFVYSIGVICIILTGIEFASGIHLRGDPTYRQRFFTLNTQPLMEYAPETKATPPFHYRRNAFSKKTTKNVSWNRNVKTNQIAKVSFNEDEGLFRNIYGDYVLSKWGFRGPYFEKHPPSNVFRIVTAGGSTTEGQYDIELTYPRILERMLNNNSNQDKSYEVINGGHPWYNSCDVRHLIQRELFAFKPNLILIMSGWNDSIRLQNTTYQTREQYCDNGRTFFDRFDITLLLNIYIDKFFPSSKKENNFKYNKILEKNFSLFEDNFKEIIRNAQTRGIDIGLVSLISVLNRNHTQAEMATLPQVTLYTEKRRTVSINVAKRVDKLYRRLSKKHDNVFYINTATTINSKGKELYFRDSIHASGAGYRMHAYGIYKTLNKRFKIHPNFKEKPLNEEFLYKDDIEVEYINSIFASNKYEDFSFAACMALHRNCTHFDREKFSLKNQSLLNAPEYPDRDYVSSVIEFAMGTLIHFGESKLHPNVQIIIENRLAEIIKMRPNLSISYWVLGQYYKFIKKKVLSENSLSKAFYLNPKLKSINFEQNYQYYLSNRIENPLTSGNLYSILKTLQFGPNYKTPYFYFYNIKNIKTKADFNKFQVSFGHLYFSSPLLIRSIFMQAAKLHVKFNEIEQAKNALQLIKTLKPKFKESIDIFQNELLKKKTAS
jgi:lysophospholipase L1-like esterase